MANTSQSLQDFAYDEIKSRIENGVYRPGEKLNTQEVSDSLGISRSPVLAAINRLISLGFVESVPRKGVVVAQLSVEKIKDIIQTRHMIESFCAKYAVQNVDFHPKIMSDMETLIEEIHNAVHTDYKTAASLETKFHTLYVKLAGNKQILKFFEMNWSIGAIFYMYYLTDMPLSHHDKSFKEHKEIFEALKAKDADLLEQRIHQHMNILYETLEYYSQSLVNQP